MSETIENEELDVQIKINMLYQFCEKLPLDQFLLVLERKIQIFNKTLSEISRELKIDILIDLTKSKVSSEIIEDDTNISHEE